MQELPAMRRPATSLCPNPDHLLQHRILQIPLVKWWLLTTPAHALACQEQAAPRLQEHPALAHTLEVPLWFHSLGLCHPNSVLMFCTSRTRRSRRSRRSWRRSCHHEQRLHRCFWRRDITNCWVTNWVTFFIFLPALLLLGAGPSHRRIARV